MMGPTCEFAKGQELRLWVAGRDISVQASRDQRLAISSQTWVERGTLVRLTVPEGTHSLTVTATTSKGQATGALTLRPYSEPAWWGLAKQLRAEGKLDEAQAALGPGLAGDGLDHARALGLLARIELRRGYLPKSRGLFGQAMQAGRHVGWISGVVTDAQAVSFTLASLDKGYAEARELLDGVRDWLKFFPEGDATVPVYLSWSAMGAGDERSALALLQQGRVRTARLAMKDELGMALHTLAVWASKNGQSRECIDLRLQLHPTTPCAQAINSGALGFEWLVLRDHALWDGNEVPSTQEALKYLKQALELFRGTCPDARGQADTLTDLAWAELQNGHPNKALPLLQQAHDALPDATGLLRVTPVQCLPQTGRRCDTAGRVARHGLPQPQRACYAVRPAMASPQASRFLAHPYASFLHEVEKPARYAGGEWGEIRKPWSSCGVRVCLAFPDVYDVGMSHLGTRILYSVLNASENVLCERCFVPWLDLETQLRTRGLPLVSLENARALRDFDVVGISLQHELVFSNVLTLLELGGIALRAQARVDADPLVLGGGSVASHPEPMAPFFDAFVVGDGERKALEVVRRWVADRDAGVPRADRLRSLASLGGVYVPALCDTLFNEASRRIVPRPRPGTDAPWPVTRALLPDLDAFPFPPTFPTGGPEAVFDRLSVELARGCSQGCRFCQAGMMFRPERERDPRDVMRSITESLAHSGQDELSLTSLSPADYSAIGLLVRLVSQRTGPDHVALAVSSLRAYGLDDATLDEIRRVRASNLTFAPEAGTQRLRDVINKNVTEVQLLESVRRVVERGWERIKLYFMIGLPTETDEDVDAVVELTARARDQARRAKKKGRPTQVTASVSTFVPKPHTPFQWCAMIDLDEVHRKHERLRAKARSMKVDIKTHEPHGSVLEGVLSRGDRRLADVIEDAWSKGARYDAWDGYVKWDIWIGAMARAGIDVSEQLAAFPIDSAIPWQAIDVGLAPEFLRKEHDRALRARTTLPCLRPAPLPQPSEPGQVHEHAKLVCLQCGAGCNLDDVDRRRKGATAALLPWLEQESGGPVPGDLPADRPLRYRFRFEKVGRAALLGHLDLVREVPRILRRAGLPLWYSRGFHPKALVTFGPALSLGVPSLDEYVDIKTTRPVVQQGLVDRINAVCPEGIRFHAVTALAPGAANVAALLVEAEVLLALAAQDVHAAGGERWVADRVASVMQAEQIVTRRATKRGERDVDIRPYLRALHVNPPAATAVLAHAGLAGEALVVRVELVTLDGTTARLNEVVDALSQGRPMSFRAVRVAMRCAGGVDPMLPQVGGSEDQSEAIET
jgi:radical SAM family uncharacterized protein/radical SAM-linked protein